MAASSQFQSLQPQDHFQQAPPNCSSSEYKVELGSSSSSSSKWNYKMGVQPSITKKPEPRIVNRPPEKRQRVPSAYNQFIKEEIQRIKAKNPDISHREAFSSAAKNWAHFPHIHFGLMLETNTSTTQPTKLINDQGSEKHQMRRSTAVRKNK